MHSELTALSKGNQLIKMLQWKLMGVIGMDVIGAILLTTQLLPTVKLEGHSKKRC